MPANFLPCKGALEVFIIDQSYFGWLLLSPGLVVKLESWNAGNDELNSHQNFGAGLASHRVMHHI